MKIKQRFPRILYNYIYMCSSSNFERFKPLQSRLNHLPYHLGRTFPSCRKEGVGGRALIMGSLKLLPVLIFWFSEETNLSHLNMGHATQEITLSGALRQPQMLPVFKIQI